jgi:hypothetical protein
VVEGDVTPEVLALAASKGDPVERVFEDVAEMFVDAYETIRQEMPPERFAKVTFHCVMTVVDPPG